MKKLVVNYNSSDDDDGNIKEKEGKSEKVAINYSEILNKTLNKTPANTLKRKEPDFLKRGFECPIPDKYRKTEPQPNNSKNSKKNLHFLPPQVKSKESNISII